MKIVIAPDSFKESLSAVDVSQAIHHGLAKVWPTGEFDVAPMADGGEGTVDAMVHATAGRKLSVTVHGPLGEHVEAGYGMLGDGKTAVIEMAAASGLPLVPVERRNPMITTTRGTGELIRSALDHGATRIIIGIGGSATTDGGAGAVCALGARLLDVSGKEIEPTGRGLKDLVKIDLTNFDPRIAQTDILVACDVDNPLTGPRGAAAVYSPQKGATDEMVRMLDENLKRYARVLADGLHVDVDDKGGAGAAGGLGAGLMAFCQARLESGAKLVAAAIGLDDRLRTAQFCMTGEGQIDGQSRFGKVCHHVAELASRHNVPAIAIVGSVGRDAEKTIPPLTAFFSIINRPMTTEQAFQNASTLIEQTAEHIARTIHTTQR